MKSQKQEPNRKPFDSFANRLRFARTKRGVTLAALSGGKPSTASSWEKGSNPRNDEWEGISEKLNLSVSLLFLGHPKSQSDFDFIAKYADEIVIPESQMQYQSFGATDFKDRLNEQDQDQAPYGSAQQLTAEIRRLIEERIHCANNDPGRLGWIREQILTRLEVPEHWDIHERVIKQVTEERKGKDQSQSQSSRKVGDGT